MFLCKNQSSNQRFEKYETTRVIATARERNSTTTAHCGKASLNLEKITYKYKNDKIRGDTIGVKKRAFQTALSILILKKRKSKTSEQTGRRTIGLKQSLFSILLLALKSK